MKQTPYFCRRVLQQRPYIKLQWCEQTVRNPEHTDFQPDGRIRHWRYIDELGKHLRVVTLGDGATLHNAPFQIEDSNQSKYHATRVLS